MSPSHGCPLCDVRESGYLLQQKRTLHFNHHTSVLVPLAYIHAQRLPETKQRVESCCARSVSVKERRTTRKGAKVKDRSHDDGRAPIRDESAFVHENESVRY